MFLPCSWKWKAEGWLLQLLLWAVHGPSCQGFTKGTLDSEMDVNFYCGNHFLGLFLSFCFKYFLFGDINSLPWLPASRSRAVTAQPSHLESVVTSGKSAPQADLGQLWREQWPGQLRQPGNTSSLNSLRGVAFSGLGFILFLSFYQTGHPMMPMLCSVRSGAQPFHNMEAPAASVVPAWPWWSSAWGERSCGPGSRRCSCSSGERLCGRGPGPSWPGWPSRDGEGQDWRRGLLGQDRFSSFQGKITNVKSS